MKISELQPLGHVHVYYSLWMRHFLRCATVADCHICLRYYWNPFLWGGGGGSADWKLGQEEWKYVCIMLFAPFEVILEKVLQHNVLEKLQFVLWIVGRLFLQPQCCCLFSFAVGNWGCIPTSEWMIMNWRDVEDRSHDCYFCTILVGDGHSTIA
jgi:hypothetical protein